MHSESALHIEVHLAERSYPIVVTSGELDCIGQFARERAPGNSAFVVCDSNTRRPYAEVVCERLGAVGFLAALAEVPPGEESKSLQMASRLYDRLIDMVADRRTVVVAVGGGVVGDLAGFVAATFARGLPFLQVPTSLLAQVDSSVGGKVAVNHRSPDNRITKNMIGAFHQPVGVFIDTATLATLPRRELLAGLGEVVKYGVILDEQFFCYLEEHVEATLSLEPATVRHVVARCCRLKADVVEADEREVSERRAILNYGHTFAHGLESVWPQLRHGEAVAMGMVAASRLAERIGWVDATVTQRQVRLLQQLGLQTRFPRVNPAHMLQVMRSDKKARGGRLRFILPRAIGQVAIAEDVPETVVAELIEEMVER